MNLTQLTRYPQDKVRSLFGLTHAALGELFAVALPEIARRRLLQQQNKPRRKRHVGGGRKRLLAPYQEVLVTLIYVRHNVAFSVVGALFDVSADVAENTFHEIVQVLRDVCPANRFEAEKRWTKKQPSWKPDEIDKLIVDSFETPVPRPSDADKQKRLYSGKKKRHTLKTQILANPEGEILDIDAGHRGPKSDQKLFGESNAGPRCAGRCHRDAGDLLGHHGAQTGRGGAARQRGALHAGRTWLPRWPVGLECPDERSLLLTAYEGDVRLSER